MTLPPVVRVFFALALPDSVKTSINHLISDIKKITKNHAIRFTKPENLHITLQFVGEVRGEHVALLKEKVAEELKNSAIGFSLQLGVLSIFPNPYRPRVIVLEIIAQEKLANLAQSIGQGILSAGYPVEKRPFRGHMTLGRIKQPRALDFSFLTQVSVPVLEAIPVAEVILFRSEPYPEGSHYTVLERLALRE